MPKGIYTRTEEFKKRVYASIANSLRGKKYPDRHYKHTEEAKRKISIAQKGKYFSPEHRVKLSIASKGKKKSPEHVEKLRLLAIGNKYASGSSRTVSEETKIKISISMSGDKCHRWKGGITPVNRAIRTSREYRLWRKAVFERDNYTCIWCGAKNKNGEKLIILNADHIKQFAYYPELRFEITNGRTLCKPCHEKTDTYRKKIKN